MEFDCLEVYVEKMLSIYRATNKCLLCCNKHKPFLYQKQIKKTFFYKSVKSAINLVVLSRSTLPLFVYKN